MTTNHNVVAVFARHKEMLLVEHHERSVLEWIMAALEAAEQDFQMANRLLGDRFHPFTWTPPLIEIALEKLREAESRGE
jgi:hypothetical protein